MNLQGMSVPLTLTIHDARLTMTLAADRKSATGGLVGGVLDTEDVVAQVTSIGASLGLCASAVLPNLVTQVRQASDILADGTQDPTKTCDGISIGFGFTMAPAQIGGVGPASPQATTCP
jgi:hypothetical protein